tara:strand:+ start:6327 stop:7010 length:684 start_codon:yes stop_codon:yes gene_type:complete
MNRIIIISILIFIIIYNIFQKPIIENYEAKTLSEYEKNKSVSDAKLSGFDSGFSGTGSDITTDTTRLDYKFAKNNEELIELTKYKPYTKNNEENLNVEYNDRSLNISTGGYGLDMGTVMVFDPSLNKIIAIPREEDVTYTTFYPPNTFKYGSQNYVPSYEDSVKLRLTTPRPRSHEIYKKWTGKYLKENYQPETEIYKKMLEIINSGYWKLQNTLDTLLMNLKLENL